MYYRRAPFYVGKGNEFVVPRRCSSPCSKTNGLTAALNASQLNVLFPFVPTVKSKTDSKKTKL
ncbi:hypothetical protein EFL05_12110 [Enterococcus faecalis]|nr:hypothetical protein [Enterococcus faecalis]